MLGLKYDDGDLEKEACCVQGRRVKGVGGAHTQ
jgi:hypothetical protein